MWLINTSTLQPREFPGPVPPYATFSHATGDNEVSFEDLAHLQRDPYNEGIEIIERACAQAQTEGIVWLWNYAACVDKRSCAAQSEAINSMAQIYRNCEHSIIYLEDLDYKLLEHGKTLERLAECGWIKNVWAIPQIVFAQEAYFYSSDWHRIGSKKSLLRDLSSMIGIDEAVLESSDCLEDYSVARRMSWASGMTALRIEDLSYALLGLFDVSMSIIYGEGPKAFLKLQEEIMRDTDDFSFLAWDNLDGQEYIGLFAHSPACFRRFRTSSTTQFHIDGEVQIHSTGITIQTSFWKTETGLFLPLQSQHGLSCGIPLIQRNGCFVRRGSPVQWNLAGPKASDNRRICVKRNVSAHVSTKLSACGELVSEDPFYHLTPLETVTTRGSTCSIMDYSSNDGTSRVESFVENLTSRYAQSISLSEVTSHEDPIAWSTHDGRSVEGTFRGLDYHVRPPRAHETASEDQYMPEGCTADDPENNVSHSTCSGSVDREVIDGFRNSMHMSESPFTEAQVQDMAPITEELASIAAEQFLSDRQKQSNKRSFSPWQSQNRKRLKLMQSSGQLEVIRTSDSEDGDLVLVKKSRFFACPFYIHNHKYTKCVTRNHLHTIDDVREHVCWEHRRPMFCPVCKEEFSSGRDRDSHIRLRTCQANVSADPEGISDDQEERIERDDKSSLSEDLRWFQIWDIIFPDFERPSSAYYTGEREVSVCAFRQFWMVNGERIVAGVLEQKDCQSYSIPSEERKLRAIYDLVMENVVDKIFVT